MTKIYFQENLLTLYTTADVFDNTPTPIIDIHHEVALTQLLSELEHTPNVSGAMLGESMNLIFDKLHQYFTPISAAGGLIENATGDYLFIFRRGKWDLPKGKMDEGESALETAVREIEEETGVTGLELIAPLPDSYHVYEAFDNRWLKTTHWFHFKTSFNGKLLPQTEEDITEIRWVKKEELQMIKANTYPAILDLMGLI